MAAISSVTQPLNLKDAFTSSDDQRASFFHDDMFKFILNKVRIINSQVPTLLQSARTTVLLGYEIDSKLFEVVHHFKGPKLKLCQVLNLRLWCYSVLVFLLLVTVCCCTCMLLYCTCMLLYLYVIVFSVAILYVLVGHWWKTVLWTDAVSH